MYTEMPVCFSKAWVASSKGGLLAEPAKTIISLCTTGDVAMIEVDGEVVLLPVVVDVVGLVQPAITKREIKDNINTKDAARLILREIFI